MSYILKYSLSKVKICEFIGSNKRLLKSVIMCPSCHRFSAMSISGNQMRAQSTNAKTSFLRLQPRKKKKKGKIGRYAEIIQVAKPSENASSIKESRTVIRKSSTKDVLSGLKMSPNHSLKKQEEVLRSGVSTPKTGSAALKNAKLVSTSDAADTEKSFATRIISPLQSGTKNQERKLSIYDDLSGMKQTNIMDEMEDTEITDSLTIDSLSAELPHEDDRCSYVSPLQSIYDHADVELLMEVRDKTSHTESASTSEKIGSIKKKSKKLRVRKCDKDLMFKVKQKELEKLAKDVSMQVSLRAFLDVCVNSNLINLAHLTLMNYRIKGKVVQGFPKITDVKLYNIIIRAHALNGDWSKVHELLSIMNEDSIKCNLQTYAESICCVSYLPVMDKKIINDLLKDLTRDGLQIENLDRECTFIEDQRERIIKVVREVLPNFQPFPRDNIRQYSCKLLVPLNVPVPKDRYYNPAGSKVSNDHLLKCMKKQMKVEVTNEVTIKSIEKRPPPDEKTEKIKSVLKECEANWRVILKELFEKHVNNFKIQQRIQYSKDISIYPFLTALDTDEFVDVMLREIQQLAESSETFSLPLTALHFMLGTKIMQRYQVLMKNKQGIVDKIAFLYEKYCEYYSNPQLTSLYTPREYWQELVSKNPDGPSIDIEDNWWPGHIIAGVGKFMYDLIIREVKINTNLLRFTATSPGLQIPAFYSIYRNSGLYVKEEIKPHPILVQMYKLELKDTLTFEGTVVPMLVPPLPWTSIRSGGYLLSSAKIVRLPEVAMQQKMQLEQTPNQQLFPIYDSLNQLGECPWIINKPMLEVVIEVFNNNGDELLDIPPPPSQCPPLPTVHPDMTKEEKAKAYQERAKLKRKRAEMYSLWCDSLYKLSIANHFKDEVFWFPHNLDFRGRVYPCPPHFNHLGGDVTRSLLLFAKGEPLGAKGLDWLKIHVINLTGFKKQQSIQNRLMYANELMSEIIDSADSPLKGNRWWTKSDEPWQTLACCKEVANALRSPDPTKYVCHFPIHQDGSCNGLQHYAALGRDQQGAREVNLSPMDTPQDVYSGVANLVEIQRAKDAADGNPIAQLLEGHVKRKVIKQTVMTTVYGVTRYGARLQILKQLKDIPEFPQDKAWVASSYLVHKTFQSLQQMFTATKEIQDWFTEIARLISQVCGQPVEWVTPLGLPVIQPYHRLNKGLSVPGLGDKNHVKYLSKMDLLLRPNVMKQKNAFPPNFIHSLDSTHMMLTSLFCQRVGITFVSVHDCYWTHPSTVSIMNPICRQQFVSLHNEPILENLSKFLIEKYSYSDEEFRNDGSVVDMAKKRLNKLLGRVPTRGVFDLRKVLKSTYFFS